MGHPVLLIEHARSHADDGLAPVLSRDSGFALESTSWDSLVFDSLSRRTSRMIVAVPEAPTERARSFFKWFRANRVGVPLVAVLPERVDDETLRCALDAADDFAFSPVRRHELLHRMSRLLGGEPETVDSVRLRLTDELALLQLVGSDPIFTRLVHRLPIVARGGSPVLITGETGTGKELFARAIHHLSERRDFPFIALDCAAVPDQLFENEFFGHVRGAFTDAHRDQRGLVAAANGGTLFLDEVDTLSPAAQAKLLRFLQHRTYKPLGSDRFLEADVNVLAATNADPETCVREKRFRSDLYFRLNVIRLHLPPLRSRRGDVALLAKHLLETSDHTGQKTFSPSALRELALYDWPGNVRELANVVQRAMLLTEGAQILPCHLELPNGSTPSGSSESFRLRRRGAIESFERRYVEEMIRKHRGNVTHAACEAGKDRRAFGRLVKKYAIDRGVL